MSFLGSRKMLRLEDLTVEINGKHVLTNINLEIKKGELLVLFGPNGSGKTSLLMTIMGFPRYKVVKGRIIFKGKDITNLPVYERAKMGIGISFQRPPTITGLKTRDLVKLCTHGRDIDIEALAKELNFTHLLDRDVNDGLSGGEIKRSELLQLMAQQPDLVLLDEPESGVDLENIALIGETIKKILGRTPTKALAYRSLKEEKLEKKKSGLIITHTGHILRYVPADKGRILYKGKMCVGGNPFEILEQISKYGYQECIRCLNGEQNMI